MADDALNLFQILVRLLFAVALVSYLVVAGVRLLRNLGGIVPGRPRVLTRHKRHIPWR